MFVIDDLLAIFAAAAPEMFVAAEGATALTTAAEIAAAEAAAATAAEVAAAEAAKIAAAEAAQVASSGIMQAAPEVASLGAETAGLQANPELMQSVANFRPETSMFGPESEQLASTAKTLGRQAPQIPTPNQIGNYPGGSLPPTGPNINQFPTPSELGAYPGGSTPPTTLDANTFPTPNQTGFQPGGSTEPTVSNFRTASDIQTEGQSPFMRGLNAATDWAKENKLQAAGLGYMAASKMGLFDQQGVNSPVTAYDGPLSKYKLSPNFRGSQANPEDFQYTPRQYASGGITGYAKGGVSHPDVGIYRDSDPDTMYLDPLTAAMVRQSKLDSRSYVNTKAKFKEPTRMGALNFKPVAGSAQGGIMQAERYDDGGVTGGGNLDLHIPLNVGGGGGGGGGGRYDGFGGGFGGGGGGFDGRRMGGGGYNGGGGGGGGGLGGLLGGLDLNSMMANPQGAMNFFRGAMNQEKSRPGSTMFGQGNQMNYGMGAPMGGNMLSGMGGTAQNGFMSPGGMGGDLYDQYVASNNKRLAEKSQVGSVASMTHDYVGPTMSRDKFEAAQNAPRNPASYFAQGGAVPSYDLGGYAAGGNPRLLRGPGDGMSDNIPATINNRQPARLADGEFVVPADVVSHLGNGSTEAGAKKLHKMMNEVRKARTGNPKQGKQINPNKYMPK